MRRVLSLSMADRKYPVVIALLSGIMAALGQNNRTNLGVGMTAPVSRTLTSAPEYDDEVPSYSPDGNFGPVLRGGHYRSISSSEQSPIAMPQVRS